MAGPTKEQLATMLQLQTDINNKANPTWMTDGTPFLRAVIVEGAEAMDHWGWKWWKKQEPNLPQFQMELVDIWHFYLAHALQTHAGDQGEALLTLDALLADLDCHEQWPSGFGGMTTLHRLEILIGLASDGETSFPLFSLLLTEDAKMSWDDLYQQYVGKNILNFFRQDNGYKEGTYRKTFSDGREDNEHLVEILKQLDPTEEAFSDQVYQALLTRYEAETN